MQGDVELKNRYLLAYKLGKTVAELNDLSVAEYQGWIAILPELMETDVKLM